MPILDLKEIHKSYGNTQALAGVSFGICEGEIIAVLGPSGCGKSTLLSVIAGLEIPDKGLVLWNGADLSRIPTHKRDTRRISGNTGHLTRDAKR